MKGLPRFAGYTHDFGDHVAARDVALWHIPGRPVLDDAAAAFAADHRQRGRSGMRAALCAARNVDGVAQRGKMARKLTRERAGCNQSRGASRFARTGDNTPAGVIAAHNEASSLCFVCERARNSVRETKQQKRAAKRKPHATCPVGRRKTGQPG